MSQDFIDEQFPPRISFGAQGGPTFNTDVVIMASGQEARNMNWSSERLRYEVAHAARREADWRQLQAFFRNMYGRAHSFRFKDWTDYICESGDGVFLTDTTSSPVSVQMYKKYTYGSQVFYRKITKPVAGTITYSGTGLDYSTGQAATGTTWHGEFDVWVRFDTDAMVAETIDKRPDGELLVGWRSIPLIEVVS